MGPMIMKRRAKDDEDFDWPDGAKVVCIVFRQDHFTWITWICSRLSYQQTKNLSWLSYQNQNIFSYVKLDF